MRQIVSNMRAFSTQVRQEQHVVIYVTNDVDRQNTLLGPSKQFPFPGDVSSKIAFDLAHEEAKISRNLNVPSVSIGEILEESTNKVMRAPSNEDNELATKKVELTAVECPRLLRKDLKELFTGIDLSQRDVCVLNLTQKTDSDMSAWSVEMEIERMQLTSAYLGKFTNATLFETDDRYRSLGFKITDLGCCKILEHALWGTNAFVGTIFTDAPVNSEAVSEIIAKVNAD
ncbi:unnamed protein product [Toxocara canis]|uniref:Methylmalonic aciduria and homocystinuria type D-like protein, mitochondrial n=1 Tax=Toxocara canis TaxID=6265 RepID=A0A183UHI2_TOXCA|nr:unnamed protein product [Toxocara canis]